MNYKNSLPVSLVTVQRLNSFRPNLKYFAKTCMLMNSDVVVVHTSMLRNKVQKILSQLKPVKDNR